MPAAGAQGQVTTQQVEDVFSQTFGKAPESVVQVGNGGSATIQIRAETLSNPDTEKLRTALFDAFQPKGADGQPSKAAISDSAVSETWGGQITQKALIALVVFLVLVSAYIAIRYERYMAAAALAALVFDLLTTAGVYSHRRLRGHAGDGDRSADDSGLLALRHGHRVRQGRGERSRVRTHHPPDVRRAGQPGDQPDVHALDQHQLDLRTADHRADRRRGVAARRGYVAGSRAGAARRRHRRHVLVDLLRHAPAGRDAGADRSGAQAHPTRHQPSQGRVGEDRGHRLRIVDSDFDSEPEKVAVASSSGRSESAGRSESPSRSARSVPATPAPDKPAPGAKPIRPTGRPSGKRNTRR